MGLRGCISGLISNRANRNQPNRLRGLENMSRIEQARRNNRRKERLAGLPETVLGLGLIVISVATFVGICWVGA